MADEQNLVELFRTFRAQITGEDIPRMGIPEATMLAAMVNYEAQSKIERQLARIASALEDNYSLNTLNENLHSLLTYGIRTQS